MKLAWGTKAAGNMASGTTALLKSITRPLALSTPTVLAALAFALATGTNTTRAGVTVHFLPGTSAEIVIALRLFTHWLAMASLISFDPPLTIQRLLQSHWLKKHRNMSSSPLWLMTSLSAKFLITPATIGQMVYLFVSH
jgi:hypothetical protein